MTLNEWGKTHEDVLTKIGMDRRSLKMTFCVMDKQDLDLKVEKTESIFDVPLEQDEDTLNTYLCSTYEKLYEELLQKKGEQHDQK